MAIDLTSQYASFSLSYSGRLSDENEIDFYDVAQALIGFQRSLALTTHLILNDEIITQAPSLRGAEIIALPPEEGSWKFTAVILGGLATSIYTAGTAPKDSPIGHLVRSAYDYIVSETLGFHVDYEKTLGQQYEELKDQDSDIKVLNQSRFDSLIEKSEVAIKNMHRPIVKSATATQADIVSTVDSEVRRVGPSLDWETYEYVDVTVREEHPVELLGRISSYNINTYKGRIYVYSEERPIPFELAPDSRYGANIARVTGSLSANALSRYEDNGDLEVVAFQSFSKSGQLKSLYIVEIE